MRLISNITIVALAFILLVKADENCTDFNDWLDADEDTCGWYAMSPEEDRCSEFGDFGLAQNQIPANEGWYVARNICINHVVISIL